MKQHKWHKEIKAWADGAEIEFRSTLDDIWDDVKGNPLWETREDWEYRIKLQPVEPQYLYVWKDNLHEVKLTTNEPNPLKEYVSISWKCIGKIPLIVESNDD